MFPPMPISPWSYTANTAAEYKLGSRYSYWDATYGYQEWMYVQIQGAVAGAAGTVLRKSSAGLGITTADIDSDQLSTSGFGGVCPITCAADSHCFVCIGGRFPDVLGDNAVAAGEYLVANADSVCDTMATLEYAQIFGEALEAFATDTKGDALIYFGKAV